MYQNNTTCVPTNQFKTAKNKNLKSNYSALLKLSFYLGTYTQLNSITLLINKL